MRAAVMEAVRQPLLMRGMPMPTMDGHAVPLRIETNGICRSDWHTWVGDWDWFMTSFHALADRAEAIRDLTKGGAHVAMDALGIAATCRNAIRSLRKRGRHLQVGMTSAAERGEIALPIDVIVGNELQILGSSGIAAPRYGPMLRMVESGKLNPAALVTRTIPLADAGDVLASMTKFGTVGVTVVDRY